MTALRVYHCNSQRIFCRNIAESVAQTLIAAAHLQTECNSIPYRTFKDLCMPHPFSTAITSGGLVKQPQACNALVYLSYPCYITEVIQPQ